MKASEAHTVIFTPHGLGHRLPERGFTHSGRPHQAQNRSMSLGIVHNHSNLFENALLYFSKAVMVAVEHLLSHIEIAVEFCGHAPGEVEESVEIT